jgi:tetratricopeptide (TPR) repeat protein
MDIPQELIKQIAEGNGVLFVGAGLSQGAGLPSWSELMHPLAQSIGVPPQTDPLKIAQYYEIKRGRQALVSHIIQQTDTTGKGPTDNHRRLLDLGVRTWWVTTNYDDLLEQTLREAGERFTKVVCDQDLSYTSADAVTLVKMHGDREQRDTIVITQKDYYTCFHKFPRVKETLSGLLLEKTFLFVGYSVGDPDFNQLQAEIAFDLQQHKRMAYAVLFDADEPTVDVLRSLHIHVINIPMEEQENYSERLGEVLQKLVHDVNSQSVQRHLQRAAEYRQQRNFEKEIQELDQALDLAPEDLDIKKWRANACLRRAYQCEKESNFVKMRDWFGEAMSVYEELGLSAKFQEADEGKQKAHLKLAEQSSARGNDKDAKDNLDQVQPDIPGYEEVRRQLRQETSLE